MADISGAFQVDGIVRQREELERLLMSNPDMEKRVQGLIRKVLLEARRVISGDIKASDAMKSDPRQAYKAVKSAVYKRILGGSVSILAKKRAAKAAGKAGPGSHSLGRRRVKRTSKTVRAISQTTRSRPGTLPEMGRPV